MCPCPGGEERSLLGGGRSGRPRPLQAGGGRVGAGAADQAEGRRRSTPAELRLLDPLHAGRVLARRCHGLTANERRVFMAHAAHLGGNTSTDPYYVVTFSTQTSEQFRSTK